MLGMPASTFPSLRKLTPKDNNATASESKEAALISVLSMFTNLSSKSLSLY
jgi:hypothetical protein